MVEKEYTEMLESVRTKFYLDNGWRSPMIAEMVGRLEDGEIVSLEDYERIDCHIVDLQALAAKRKELLRRCNEIMPTCPCCKGNLRTWERIAYNESKRIGHADDCELAKELGDD